MPNNPIMRRVRWCRLTPHAQYWIQSCAGCGGAASPPMPNNPIMRRISGMAEKRGLSEESMAAGSERSKAV
jgi:hypothetical protein